MSDTSQGEGWWKATDGKWYAPKEQQPTEPSAAPPPPAAVPATPPPAAAGGQVQLPAGVTPASPWKRLGSYFLEYLLIIVTLGIGWLIWAATIGGTGQTPAKRLLNLRVISCDKLVPIGLGRMFWMRGVVAGWAAAIAIPLTLTVLAFMPFWDKRNQNIWDKVSSTYVVDDPTDAWGTKPDLR